MEKSVLVQLADIKREIKDLERRITKTREKLQENENLIVSDTVKGTRPDGTYGPIKITGLEQRISGRQRRLLMERLSRMEVLQELLREQEAEAEKFIAGIQSSRLRSIARYRCLDGLGWVEIARRVGGTPDSCRMEFERLMKKYAKK